MLHDFLVEHREEILGSTRRKIATVAPKRLLDDELENSLPEYLDEIIAALRVDAGLPRDTERAVDVKSPTAHGRQRLHLNFSLRGVVHDYGSLCDSISDAARKYGQDATSREYQILNQVLDIGIAEAVTEYADTRERNRADEANQQLFESLGFVAHELRNVLSSAMFAFEAIRSGKVPVQGRTSDIVSRNHAKMRSLIDRSLAQVRIGARAQLRRRPSGLAPLMREVEAGAIADLNQYGVELRFETDPDLTWSLDRQLIASAVGNLVQNAIKYTEKGSTVLVRTQRVDSALQIEIEDRCGGITGEAEHLFDAFVRGDEDAEGIGLGLAIAQKAVEAHGGAISVQNLPGKGCIFTIQIPDAQAERSAREPSHPPPTH